MSQPRYYQGGGGRNYAGQVRANYPALSITGVVELVEQELPLVSTAAPTLSTAPTTTFPVGAHGSYDPGLFDSANNRMKEPPCPGQLNIWRVRGSYANKVAGSTRELSMRLYNPDSGFSLHEEAVLSSGLTAGDFTFTFMTIADSASLPVGRGYKLGVTYSTTNAQLVIAVSSITRLSMAVEMLQP